MKYIKYPFYDSIIKKESKFRFKNLDKEARRNVRINNIFTCFIITLYVILVVSFILLIKYLLRIIENKLFETLMMIGMVLATIVVPVVIIVLAIKLIGKYIPSSAIGELSLQNIQDITKPLKKYYRVSGPSIVTKCYNCTNESFTNKDVIIFLYNGKIRIVLDFNHTIKDFGCYEIEHKEMTTSYVVEEGKIKTLLKTENIEFYLGKKAKAFIRKCFALSKCPCCGYYTFIEIERGNYDICPVCFWEDDIVQEKNPNYDGGANRVSLVTARSNFKKYGACEKEMVKYCRPPKENEKKNI
ncbi:MAG: CPCC family cysteine-rich protein [Bacilli bacterium]